MAVSKIPRNFIKALQAKECILFIGSGVSRWSGLPDWEGLLRKLLGFMRDHGLNEDDEIAISDQIQQGELLTAASLCRYKMRGSDLRDFMDDTFINPKPRPHKIHELLVKLGPDSFITTNYDRLIEDAYQTAHDGLVLAPINNDQLIEQATIMKHGSSRFIFTPHGRIDKADTIILSREDYRRIQYGSKSITTCLEHLFVSRPIVYIGFSLKDPDFLMIKDQITATYNGYEREHFAILPDISEMMKQFWRDNYGINIISYKTIENEVINDSGQKIKQRSHELLLELLKNILEELHPPFSGKNILIPSCSSLSQEKKEETDHAQQVKSAIVRFCENVKLSFLDDRTKNVEIFASLRTDLSPKSRLDVNIRDLSILEIFDSVNNLAIIGSPGSGKTYAVESYGTILAQRSLDRLRSINFPNKESFKLSLPLILPMKEYNGDIVEMIAARLPRSIDVTEALRLGYLILIFDAMNEASKNFFETRVLEHDISLLFSKYPSNRFIFTSRLPSYLPSLALPIFELQPIRLYDLYTYLSIEDRFKPQSSWMERMLQNPLFLSLFSQLRGHNTCSITNPAMLLQSYFLNAEEKLAAWKNMNVSIESLLSPIAYELVDNGSQTMISSQMEDKFDKILAKDPEYIKGRNRVLLDSLISMKVLVPDADGKVGFFHQIMLEFMAAKELVSRYNSNLISLRDLNELYRWDETIILFIILLPSEQRITILRELSDIDIFFACKAFESATIKDESIGFFLFDLITERLSNPLLPDAKKEELACALQKLIPFGRAENLINWLEDKTIAGSAAVFLANMGVKDQIPRIITLLLEDNKWPSDFADALYTMADESIIAELISNLKKAKYPDMASTNVSEVLKRFESDTLYSELDKLIASSDTQDRVLAAKILSKFESQRSREVLAEMLQDANADVLRSVIYGFSGLYFGAKLYKTDFIVNKMFELLSSKDVGDSAADYLFNQSDTHIIQEAKDRIITPRNDHDLMNLCVILSKDSPDIAHKFIFDKIQTYHPDLSECLRNALAKLPIEYVLPGIYKFLYIENEDLRRTIFSALRSMGGYEDQLPITKKDCEYILSLWEKSLENSEQNIDIGYILSDRFQSISKSLLLSRLSDPKYPCRIQILPYIERLPLVKEDISLDVLDWLVTMLVLPAQIPGWNPISDIIGKLADESLINGKLIPLLSSSNDVVRSNTYLAIRKAENRIGKRILKENKILLPQINFQH